jgi:hypothetical protein
VRAYGTYPTARWTDPRLSALNTTSKLIDAYLFTSPHTTMIGCFRVPLAYIAVDLGIPHESVVECINELVRARLIAYDNVLSIVLIPEFFESGQGWNGNQCIAAIKVALQIPKELSFYDQFLRILVPHLAALPKDKENPFARIQQEQPNPSETLSKHLPEDSIQEQKQEPDQEAEPGSRTQEEKQQRLALVERIFSFYCEALGRNPKQYTLTDDRRKKAMLRLGERLLVHEGRLSAVEDEFTRAVENLAADEWLCSRGHTGWTEQIFKSPDEFEKRLNQKPTGGSNGPTGANFRNASKTAPNVGAAAQAIAFATQRDRNNQAFDEVQPEEGSAGYTGDTSPVCGRLIDLRAG